MPNDYLQFVLLLVAIAVIFAAIYIVAVPLIRHWAYKTPNKLDDLLVDKHLVSRSLQIVPAMTFATAIPQVLNSGHWLYDVCFRASNIWFTLLAFSIGCAVLDVVEHLNGKNERMMNRPLHGIFQALKVAGFCVAAIFVVSQVTDKSPVIILSALGAMATVLMLIFRDSILGVVSGVQINLSDLLRKGDWIEIERHHTDGKVLDITLTSVKVRNWDNTISVIPAYDLITNSFRNWRGMQELGGRRIKRSLYIDQKSIRFLTPDDVCRLSKIDILAPYLSGKVQEIEGCGGSAGFDCAVSDSTALNCRHLTNIGTFRAYCTAYLKSRDTIAQGMTLMTRQLPPTPQGLPLEIYAFANTVDWVAYESIQADIFDHLIAALPEFGLALYQYGAVAPAQKLN